MVLLMSTIKNKIILEVRFNEQGKNEVLIDNNLDNITPVQALCLADTCNNLTSAFIEMHKHNLTFEQAMDKVLGMEVKSDGSN